MPGVSFWLEIKVSAQVLVDQHLVPFSEASRTGPTFNARGLDDLSVIDINSGATHTWFLSTEYPLCGSLIDKTPAFAGHQLTIH